MAVTLITLAVALLAGLLMSRLAKKIGLPAVTAYLVAGLLLGPFCLGRLAVPGIDIRVAVLSYDKSMKPKTPNKDFIFGNDILMFYANPNPTEFDPSFMKTFSIGNQSVEDVYTYRDDSCRSDILAVDWSEDVEVVSNLCAKRISLV